MSTASTVASAVTRAKVSGSRVQYGRTILQITGQGDTYENVELLLPPGYVARPITDSDVLVHQVTGTRDHKVAVGGDTTVDGNPTLQPGEIGLSRGGRSIILRLTGTEIIDPVQIVLNAPDLVWTPDNGATMLRLLDESFVPIYNEHTHQVPDIQTGGATATSVAPVPQVAAPDLTGPTG